jgi:tricorn protease-like protein
VEVTLGQGVRRKVTSLAITPDALKCYCGTTTGDILEIDLAHHVIKSYGPLDKKGNPVIQQGIESVALSPADGTVVAGAGSGAVYKVDPATWTIRRKADTEGPVTTILPLIMPGPPAPAPASAMKGFIAATALAKIYFIPTDLTPPKLRISAPVAKINDICFAYDYSELFVTCAGNTVSVWNASTAEELLHIEDPDRALVCTCVCVSRDGRRVVSGWSDGHVRVYTPETGKFLYQIENAHHGAVTALCMADSGSALVTGGHDGLVRTWTIGRESRILQDSLKEHKAPITSLALSKDNSKCLSSSTDGTAIIWDLARKVRSKAFFANAAVQSACFSVDETQVIVGGAEKKLTVFDVATANRVRDVTAATLGVTCVAISPDGNSIATGALDKSLKVWSAAGVLLAEGFGHCGAVTKVKFAPNGSYIVSAGDNGAVYLWTL